MSDECPVCFIPWGNCEHTANSKKPDPTLDWLERESRNRVNEPEIRTAFSLAAARVREQEQRIKELEAKIKTYRNFLSTHEWTKLEARDGAK